MAEQFRPRNINENMADYLKLKQDYEIANTGTSGVSFGNETMKSLYGETPVKSAEEIQTENAQNALISGGYGITKDAQGNYVYTAPSQSDIYNKTLDQFQAQIDALDRLYATKKAEMTTQLATKSTGEIGSQRAIMAGAGMLGQVSGMAQKSNLQTEQEARLKTAEEGLSAELGAKKEALYGNVRTMAQNEYNNRISVYSQGIEKTLQYLKDRTATKSTNVSNIVRTAILNNIPLDNPKDEWLSRYSQELGVPVSQIVEEYNTQKSVYDAEQLKTQQAEETRLAGLAKTTAETAKLGVETTGLGNKAPDTIGNEKTGIFAWNPQSNKYDILVIPPVPTGKTLAEIAAEKVDAETKQTAIDKAQNALDVAKDLKEKFDAGYGNRAIGSISGILANILPSPKTGDFIAKYDQLKGLMSLDFAKYLKGSGQISDAERKLLADSATSLNRKLQSPAEFAKTLNAIIANLEKATVPLQSSGTVIVIAPDGTEGTIPADQLQDALNQGYKQK